MKTYILYMRAWKHACFHVFTPFSAHFPHDIVVEKVLCMVGTGNALLTCTPPPPPPPSSLVMPQGHAVCQLPEASDGQVHHGHGQEVAPGALHLCLLPQATQQGHLQGAPPQPLLPALLHQALRLGCPVPVFSSTCTCTSVWNVYPCLRVSVAIVVPCTHNRCF